jgi:hypothetical protein
MVELAWNLINANQATMIFSMTMIFHNGYKNASIVAVHVPRPGNPPCSPSWNLIGAN